MCVLKNTRTFRHTYTHTAGCERAVLGGYKKQGFWDFGAARAEDTHMRVFLDSQHPEDTHRGVLRSV